MQLNSLVYNMDTHVTGYLLWQSTHVMSPSPCSKNSIKKVSTWRLLEIF